MKVLKLIAGGIGVCLLIVAAKLAIDAWIIQPWIVAQADMALEDERAFESIVAFWRNRFPESSFEGFGTRFCDGPSTQWILARDVIDAFGWRTSEHVRVVWPRGCREGAVRRLHGPSTA
jgi:hypothetical protein